jgi:hypothetical protein
MSVIALGAITRGDGHRDRRPSRADQAHVLQPIRRRAGSSFAGAKAFEASILKHLTEAGDDLAPIDAAVVALTRGGLELSQYGDFARARRELIASSPELQERDLIKMTSLASAIAEALRQ